MRKLAYRAGLGLVGAVILTGCGIINIKSKGANADSGTEPVQDQGTFGALHEANKGKLVFAKSAIPKDAPATFGLADEFRLTEQIFARAFFAKSPQNTLAGMADPHGNCRYDNRRNLHFSLAIDDGPEQGLDSGPSGKKTWATYTTLLLTDDTGGLLPQDKQVVLPQDRNTISARLAMRLAKLSDAEHRLKFEHEGSCNGTPESTTATGEIRVFVDAAGRTHLAKQIRLAEAGMKTQPDEAKRLADAAAAMFHLTKVLHFRPIQDAWNVRRGARDEPIDRSIIAMSLLEENGKCTLRTSEIVEAHEGGGKYGAPRFKNTIDGRLGPLTDLEVPCDIDVAK